MVQSSAVTLLQSAAVTLLESSYKKLFDTLYADIISETHLKNILDLVEDGRMAYHLMPSLVN